MSKVLIIGGGAAGMLAGIFDTRSAYMKRTRNWGKSFLLQERADAT